MLLYLPECLFACVSSFVSCDVFYGSVCLVQVFVALLCAVAGAAAGNAVAWPGAIPVSTRLHSAQIKTIIPPEINGFAYSTSQYINAVSI